MDFTQINSGIRREPFTMVIYGVPGVGKSTLASGIPGALFMDLNDGTGELNVTRLPKISLWEDVLSAVGWLYTEDHEFSTVVIDSASELQEMVYSYVCRQESVTSLADIDYGKGYDKARTEFESLIRGLQALKLKGMNVVVLAHATVNRFNDPEGEAYDHYALAVDPKRIGPMLISWTKNLFFLNHEKSTIEKKEGATKRRIAKSYGDRIVHTEYRAAYEAKNRFQMPEKITLPPLSADRTGWEIIESHMNDFYNANLNEGTKDAA